MTVAPPNSTLAFIESKVRRLTASASESALPTALLEEYINNYYNSDFPYSIKIDQQRSVYTFFTEPYRDRYPIDVNFNQGLRAPVYFEGIQGNFFKTRDQLFNLYPRFPTLFHPPVGTNSGTITGVNQPTNPAQIVTNTSTLITGDQITIFNVIGMTQLNGITYTITVVSPTLLTLNGIDNTAFTPYISGGTWVATTVQFTIPGPFLSKEVVLGGVDVNGNPISINDDGNGNLQLQIPNPVTSVPSQQSVYPGMKNLNTGNPGYNNVSTLSTPFTAGIGTVDYVTGVFNINFPTAPDPSIQMTLWVSQYQTGRPYNLLFWNNELTIRPVPKRIHKIEVEAYLTPCQFLATTDNPILNQWAQLIAYGAAAEILRDRQDPDGVANLMEGFARQEALVLERQATEEIGISNITLFTTTQLSYGFGAGLGSYN